MKKCALMAMALLPLCAGAQGISNNSPFQWMLDQLYREMMPMCKGLIDTARLIGGFGALWYIGLRVWKAIASAEPVDVFGLLRPFALGICILLFPSLIDLINGMMQPVVSATALMVKNPNQAIENYLWHKQNSTPALEMLNPANWVREAIRLLLELLFEVATLAIDVIRIFYLIVLAIIGPLVFALSIYDGFQHLVTVWLARYINVFLWLPVANIFSAIISTVQQKMIMGMPGDMRTPALPISIFDWAYLLFLLIGIIGYCTVPSVANYIVNAGGGNALLHKVSSLSTMAVKKGVGFAWNTMTGGAGGAATGMSADTFGDAASKMSSGMSENGVSGGYFKDKVSGK